MPRQRATSIENNFSKGLLTEVSGLNFPENAATDTDNCVFDITGEVSRRLGIDYETDGTVDLVTRNSSAISTFKWTNAGGEGTNHVLVVQVGDTLYFYRYSTATAADPLSSNLLVSTADLSTFTALDGTFDATLECQFTEGTGDLFVFHPSCDPTYCTYVGGTVTQFGITIRTRDFQGIAETIDDLFRPVSLTASHDYNLRNQGWTNSPAWTATSTTSQSASTLGSKTFTVESGLTITPGQSVTIKGFDGAGQTRVTLAATVTSYSGTTLVVNVTSTTAVAGSLTQWTFTSQSTSKITDWLSDIGNYPSNADIWWYFKNADDEFDPTGTLENVTLSNTPAPKGFFILEEFTKNRITVSDVTGLPDDTTTTVRPKTGAWFQGRVWYAGADAEGFTENLYFSRIVENRRHVGDCYQLNDPTSENRFDLLPSDGGVIRIQGCGTVFKLFPVRNGLLIFAENGLWFITGSQGTGFTANDYTVIQIGDIKNISTSSFVNVEGTPIWWNEDGIYTVAPTQQGGLEIKTLTHTTIASFYQDIPLTCKRYSRGAFDPVNKIVQWVYRSTEPETVDERFDFDRVLNFHTLLNAFYPWTFSEGPLVNGINFIPSIGGSTADESKFKYLTTNPNLGVLYGITFSDEHDTDYVDWDTPGTADDFTSYFITGYKLSGESLRKFQINYIRWYCNNETASVFDFVSRWDYSENGDTGRWSSTQRVTMDGVGDYSYRTKRLKVRGHGLVNQMKVTSVSGQPFNITGWSRWESSNAQP